MYNYTTLCACTMSDPNSAKIILVVFIKHPKKLKLLEILGRCECRRRINKQQGLGYVLRNHGTGTYILQVLEKAKLYSFRAHPLSISMRVGSAPPSTPIIQKTVRRVNRPSFPLFQGTLGIGETIIPRTSPMDPMM